MKKNYQTLLFLCLCLFQLVKAQLPPIMNNIQGPSLVCSMPGVPKTFTANASSSPSSYNWSVQGPSGAIISSPSASATAISFPYASINASYTLYCSASNIAGTSNTSSFVVHLQETPSVTFSGNNIFCQGSSTNLSASPTILSSSSTLTYSWSPSTGLNSTLNYSVHASPATTTNYTVLLTLGSCTNTSMVSVVVVTCAVGIHGNELNTSFDINTFPNPNQGSFYIQSDKDVVVTLVNELGQTLRNISLLSEEKTKITGLKPGLYFIISPSTRKKIIVTD